MFALFWDGLAICCNASTLQDVDEESKQEFRAPIGDTQVLLPPLSPPKKKTELFGNYSYPIGVLYKKLGLCSDSKQITLRMISIFVCCRICFLIPKQVTLWMSYLARHPAVPWKKLWLHPYLQ